MFPASSCRAGFLAARAVARAVRSLGLLPLTARALANRRLIQRQRRIQPQMFGAQTALRIAPDHVEHPVAHQRPTLAMHGRDVREDIFAALLRANEAEALLVVPVFQRASLFHAPKPM